MSVSRKAISKWRVTDLQQQALLRVHDHGFGRRQAKGSSIEVRPPAHKRPVVARQHWCSTGMPCVWYIRETLFEAVL